MKYTKPINLLQDLLKSNASQRGRLLGLDVGDKYVGLAVSDYHNQIASPLSVLLRKKTNIDLMATDFKSLLKVIPPMRRDQLYLHCGFSPCLLDQFNAREQISELSLSGFVFGYPFYRSRSSPDAVQVKLLVEDLCRTGHLEGLKYTFWDECFTSKNVEMLLKDLNLHPVQSKSIIDKFAAVGILQGYLDFANKQTKKESVDEDLF